MTSAQDATPANHQHHAMDCPDCSEHHPQEAEEDCAGHCLSQAKTIAAVPDGSFLLSEIALIPAVQKTFLQPYADDAYTLSPVSSPPARLIVRHIVMRL